MKKTRIQYIKEAAKKLVDSKLQRLNAAKTQEIFQGVMQTVGLESLEEVYLFVAQFDLTCRDRTSNMDDLSSYFECSSLDMLEFIPALKSLERKGLLVRRYKRESNIFKQQFVVSDVVMADIIDNRPVTIGKVDVGNVQTDKYEFCKSIAEKADDDEVVTDDLVLFTEKQEQSCAQLPLVKKIKKDVPAILDRILFYDMCRDNFEYDGIQNSAVTTTMKDIYSNIGQRILTKKSIMNEEHPLIRLGLIELVDEDEMALTDEGKKYFYEDDIQAFCQPLECNDIYDFMEKVREYFHDSDNYDSRKSTCASRLRKALHKLENANKHISIIQKLCRLIPDEFERVLLYSIGGNLIEDESTSLFYEIRRLYPLRQRQTITKEFKDNEHTLQKKGLVAIEKSSAMYGENTTILLTDKGKEALLGEDAALYIDNVSDKQLLASDKIAEKKLFFSGELKEQLSLLSNSLSEEHYKALCSRLEENRLPKGIAVLLYGEPGTGKTESVMQIARATGRAIMHVDISATKTCWFGESEKLIKKVFTDYRRLCEKSKICPILLFNEADAVFSKRKDAGSSSVAQTENAIQNIILEEMEKLDGILIATTNLADNLDRAFERRFLFKIRFDKPTIEAKTSIWMNKLPDLSAEDAHTLATSYDFSGGQIDNITRKALMQEIIKGEKPTLNNLVTICSEENISRNSHRKIGYLG